MYRRTLLGMLTLGSSLILPGCPVQGPSPPPDDLWAQVKGYAVIGFTALGQVVKILTDEKIVSTKNGAVLTEVVEKIRLAFEDIAAAVDTYGAAPQEQKGTAVDRILTALVAAASQVEELWRDLEIPRPEVASTVEVLIVIIVSTARGFAVRVAPVERRSLPLRAVSPGIPPQERSVEQFRADFNARLKERGYEGNTLK